MDGSDEKEGDSDEDHLYFSNEVLFRDVYYQDCTSFVSQDYSDGCDLTNKRKKKKLRQSIERW